MVQVAGGKQFAKRATMWDAMFIGVGSLTSRRDEGLLAVVIKLVFRVLINLTMGLFMAVLEFVFSVWRVSVSGTWQTHRISEQIQSFACCSVKTTI